jgi:serine/threonine protein kinase
MRGGFALAEGTVFAKDYRIERALAAGGMGAVYVALQLSTGRKRALKLMHPDYVHDEDARRRFVLEARIGAKIESEHVVEVHAAGIDDETGSPYLVMELLEGEDLATRLARTGPLPASELRDLFRQICHALGAAHENGIVHRDLKPQNIFLGVHKRVDGIGFHAKVLDFGIAKLTTEQGSRTGLIGTPLWMAPEQAEHGPVTPGADVWALGLIMYTALTGLHFWRSGNAAGSSVSQILREMLFDRLPSASERAREQGVADRFPLALEATFAKCVVRKVDARFADATSLWLALDAAIQGGTNIFDGSAPPLTERSSAPALPPAPSSAPARRAPKSVAGAGTAFEDTAFDLQSAPSLELAIEPRAPSIPSPSAPTLAAGVGMGAIVAARPPGIPITGELPAAASRPVLADSKRKVPMFLVWLVALGLVAGGIFFATLQVGRPQQLTVLCRLCTVESKTSATGALPLRNIRNRVEQIFPTIDSECVAKAKESGRVTITFKLDDGGYVKHSNARGSSDDEATQCVVHNVTTQNYGYLRGTMLGPTDVVYTLDWNPNIAR